ncbi:glycerophosphoryl diester phosphodiesterase [Devosia pacifica]|uniref:Glycerophosphoryl diester phosphodiesterase n=2 Tax=Devosia pacifica TaxID=1335967 RepID=A0A918VTY3_9HYPH|nr:glycerophosphoryl diester phosphodiesterase [Devosia pacifica]
MTVGASIEVDLVVTGDNGFAVLHNLELSEETTGSGLVSELGDDALRQLYLRDNTGAPTDQPVMLLGDLCRLMAAGSIHSDALLQLDYKQDETVLNDAAIRNFREATAPVASNLILSSGSARAVDLLAGLGETTDNPSQKPRIGYDPCSEETITALQQTADYRGFVDTALATSPDAEMIYLAWQLVIELDREGFDVIGAFHDAGRRVDAWTIRTVNDDTRPIIERLLELRVDQITTDDPQGVASAFAI